MKDKLRKQLLRDIKKEKCGMIDAKELLEAEEECEAEESKSSGAKSRTSPFTDQSTELATEYQSSYKYPDQTTSSIPAAGLGSRAAGGGGVQGRDS